MHALVFASQEALEVALRSGLIPAEVQKVTAQVGVAPDGTIEVVPASALSAPVVQRLTQAGVASRATSVVLTPVSCWAEAVRPRKTSGDFEVPRTMLFALPREKSLIAFASELIRLGCDRQELLLVGTPAMHCLARVVEPPFFAVAQALEHEAGVTAFVPVAGSQERVWLEVGYAHRVLDSLVAPASGLLLVTGDGTWHRVADGEWLDVDSLIDAPGLPAASAETPRPFPRIPVAVRLARAANGAGATFFVLRDGLQAVEALVRSSPESVLDSILFAVSERTVVLRLRPGRSAAIDALPGEPFAPVSDLANLYVPVGFAIEPPLRRDRLRHWLAPDTEVLTWLEASAQGFSRHTIAESAFRPLGEWVDYIVDGATETLSAWVRSATFAFDTIVGVEEAPRADASSAPTVSERRPKGGAERRPSPSSVPEPEASPPSAPAHRTPVPVLVASETPVSPSALDVDIAREEAAFLELDEPHESPARQAAWARLATLYGNVQRFRDAGMAWAHALWSADDAQAAGLAERWEAATSARRGSSSIPPPNGDVEAARASAAFLANVALKKLAMPSEVVARWHAYFDGAEVDLDIRSAWLARVALSRLSGGDALALARARDRVLRRLQRGLSIDRDVPRLVSSAAQMASGGAGTTRAQKVAQQLELLLRAFAETPRKRSTLEAAPRLTNAYVAFEFAWGFARIGQGERARQLLQEATAAVDVRNPVHAYLTRAYAVRVTQAIEAVSPETPLPQEVTMALTSLIPIARFAVDRLRSHSAVLEPHERLDPFAGFVRAVGPARGEDLQVLRNLADPTELLKGIEERARAAADTTLPPEERVRILDGLCDLVPRLPEATAIPMLQRLVALADGVPAKLRALVVEDALRVAGHFGRGTLVRQLVGNMASLLSEVGSAGVQDVGATLLASLRSLRRVGLRDEAAELLTRAAALMRGDEPETLQARLALAGGFAYLGNTHQAAPIIESALQRLAQESGLLMPMRLKLTLAVARAVGNGSTETALPQLLRLAQQLPWITDTYNTREYFCLSVVAFADALVVGHVGEDLTLNETTRRFVDEDEFAVRRRIHRDVAGQ